MATPDMDVWSAKLASMIIISLSTGIAGMLPVWFSERTRQKHPLLLSCLLCFGAGVLLSTSLAHMLPEAREKLPEYSELALCIGFFLVYLVDEVVHLFYRRDREFHESAEETERTRLLAAQRPAVAAHPSYAGAGLLVSSVDDARMAGHFDGDGNSRMSLITQAPCTKSVSGLVGLMVALLVHSVIEGLAIGLQDTSSQVYILLGAVLAHKLVVAFCVGVELCDSLPGRLGVHFSAIVMFTMGSTIGIFIGMSLDSFATDMGESMTMPVMQALAAGTLLYVTVLEVLPRERAKWHSEKRSAGPLQFLSVIIGFTVMYLTTTFLDHDGA